jgi:hypothetical protein
MYRMLNKLSADDMDTLLGHIVPGMLKAYTPDVQDVFHNWFTVLWARREGVHGDKIKEFFATHDWVFDTFAIQRDLSPPSWSQTFDWNFFGRWHNSHLWGGMRRQVVPN